MGVLHIVLQLPPRLTRHGSQTNSDWCGTATVVLDICKGLAKLSHIKSGSLDISLGLQLSDPSVSFLHVDAECFNCGPEREISFADSRASCLKVESSEATTLSSKGRSAGAQKLDQTLTCCCKKSKQSLN